MMKIFLIILLCIGFAEKLVAQASDSLPKQVEQALQEANLPYKDVKGALIIQYNTSQSKDVLRIETSPKNLLDHEALLNIAEKIPFRLHQYVDSVHIWANFKIDDFTDCIFFSEWLDIKNPGRMYNTVVVAVEPARGKAAFAERWLAYLYQHIPVDTSVRGIDMKKVSWLQLTADRRGTPEAIGASKDHRLLNNFLKSEYGWRPAIRDGRPINTRVSLALPERLPAGNMSKYVLNDLVIYDEHVIGMPDKPVFFTVDKDIARKNINLISAVNNNRQMDAVVYHKGDLKQCQAMEILLRENNPMKLIHKYFEHQFDRFYFYTYQDELVQ